jgi:O-antigen/teichoic acid export membrane protein
MLRTLLRNVLSNWAGFLVEACVAFYLSPFVIHTLGDTSYGIWILLTSLTGYFGILNLGLRPAINKYVAEFSAKGDERRLNETVSTVLSIYVGLGTIVVLVSAGLFSSLDSFRLPAELLENRWVVIIFGLQLALSLPAVVFGGVVSGMQRYDIHNAIGVSTNLARAIATVLVLPRYPTLMTLASITFGASLVGYVLLAWAARRQCPSLQLRLGKSSAETLLMLFRYSGIAALITLGTQLFFYADSFIVGGLISIAAVTHYAIATSLISYVKSFIGESTTMLNPAASALAAGNREDMLRTLAIYSTRLSLALTLPIALGLMFLGKEFIVLWMGPNYSGSATILAILAGMLSLSIAQTGTVSILYGLGRHNTFVKLVLIEGILNVGLSITLASVWGLVGIALGNGIAASVLGVVLLPRLVCREMRIPITTYFREAFLAPLVSAIPMALVLALLVVTSSSYTWPHFIVCGFISVGVYAPVAFFCCLNASERSKTYWFVRRLFSTFATRWS